MAERSFAREVEMLRVPAETEFRGEGILAVTKALMEAGVAYVSGCQGSPAAAITSTSSSCSGPHSASHAGAPASTASMVGASTWPGAGTGAGSGYVLACDLAGR